MTHVSQGAFASAIELKEGDGDDPIETVTKSLEDLTSTVDERIKAIEEKADTSKLTERLDALEKKANRPAPSKSDEDVDEAAETEKKSFGLYLRLGDRTPLEELKALTVSDDTQGGYLAPAEMSTEFIRELVEFSPIRSLASVRSISGPSVKYPKRTGITNAQWEGEGEDSEESTVTLGQTEVTARKLMTYVDISNELLTDSGGTAQAEVNLALAEDYGQKEATAFVSGDGVKEPEGLLTNPDVEYTANGHATNLDTDKLIDCMYALPSAYRNAGTWLMNGTTLAAIRKLKNTTTGEYIWQPSIAVGQPETILGRPVVEAVDMPDIEDDAYPIMFGDFGRAYRIIDRLAMSVLVNPYLLATKGLTRIHATRRVGGRVIQPSAIRKFRMED
ncbi:phage major capsid protein [Cucumibacter marinus]|uniref:phage major capsid protein n=1 Tax=Cucumibacter marinus TaxID=1121252 RepID=UPI00041F74E4|nr:phage major capsid protein [Cucumibacter marinus]